VITVVVAVGALMLAIVSILCFAAYKTKEKEFEFSTIIWRVVSFKFTIKSPEGVEPGKSPPISGPNTDGGERRGEHRLP
jgi:hypothetical protein